MTKVLRKTAGKAIFIKMCISLNLGFQSSQEDWATLQLPKIQYENISLTKVL